MDVQRKERLGSKWSCYSCQAKFYDLGKAEPVCPKCGADQRESPALQKKSPRPRPRKAAKKVEVARLPDLESEDDSDSSSVDDDDSDTVLPVDEIDPSEVAADLPDD